MIARGSPRYSGVDQIVCRLSQDVIGREDIARIVTVANIQTQFTDRERVTVVDGYIESGIRCQRQMIAVCRSVGNCISAEWLRKVVIGRMSLVMSMGCAGVRVLPN